MIERANEQDFWQQDYYPHEDTKEILNFAREVREPTEEVENFAEDEIYHDWE